MACNNKSFTFENFYSLPVPLPANSKTTFYVNLIRRVESPFQKIQLIAYGVHLNKFKTLENLCEEIKKISQSDQNFVICEIAQNRIYRIHEDLATNLCFISKRTNQLNFYETLDERKMFKEERRI